MILICRKFNIVNLVCKLTSKLLRLYKFLRIKKKRKRYELFHLCIKVMNHIKEQKNE